MSTVAMHDGTRISVDLARFGKSRKLLLKVPGFEVLTSSYPGKVPCMRVVNARGRVDILPYKGMQIWRAKFDGRQLAMHSMFKRPDRARDYLASYGAFFLHCGITAMGDPGPEDQHPLHGELPSARFSRVFIDYAPDNQNLTIGAIYRHKMAFASHYEFRTEYALSTDDATIACKVAVTNLRPEPMHLMYLGHANFRPAAQARLLSNQVNASEIAARSDEHATETVSSLAFPSGHVARRLQIWPDGSADYAWHHTDALPFAVEWRHESGVERAFGLSLPGTCTTMGQAREIAAGRVPTLSGNETWRASFGFGLLNAIETGAMLEQDNSLKEPF